MATKTFVDPKTNEVTKVYHRNRTVAIVLALFLGFWSFLYSREYKAFFIAIAVMVVGSFIFTGNTYSTFMFLMNIGIAGRFITMSNDKFFNVVNRNEVES